MAPNDWRMLFKLILISAQCTVWLAEWKDLATARTMDNIENLEVGGLHELLGQGIYAPRTAQANLACAVLQQSSKRAIRALKSHRVQKKGLFLGIYSARPSAFIDRLQTAISRQIENEEAGTILLLQLALEN